MAIVAVVTRTAPWLKPTAPTVETVRSCRFELRYVEEASSARRVAGAYKVRGIGFDETTKLGEGALTSNVTIEPTEGAPLEDVIMRAAYCPLGGTSEKVVSSINLKCFARLRDMLRRWECKFYEMYPEDTWTGPDPSRLGLHQLGGGGAIQSDTCNGARCAKRLLAELVAKEVEADAVQGVSVQGVIDWVQDRQQKEGTVPLDDSLVGAMLEVRWRYRHKVTGKPIYIWCTGEVLQVADGGTTKKSQRCKNVLPLGAVRIKWPADVSSLTKRVIRVVVPQASQLQQGRAFGLAPRRPRADEARGRSAGSVRRVPGEASQGMSAMRGIGIYSSMK
eukprot:CAMPEP_0174751734 /NCGR_PEP_ID=MMETSP1094-20130205/100470_1 /TAXON_ID=156173 /ORGANISM="Chrysochromulina brevifilum, Strain UTEX LB 985" /LENGTH=333 /DNA_ID=CAMNT_0015957267 /DNA_START=1 /DNA_END=1001 /DNA_ORIENTATION=+